MKHRLVSWFITLPLALLVLPLSLSIAGQEEDTLETARLLAILLDSGRVTVAKHQDQINAPSNDDKKFTLNMFKAEVLVEFQKRTDLDLTKLDDAPIPQLAKPLLTQLLNDSIKTIQTYQPVLSLPSMRYKGLIPATFGTETASRFQNSSKIYMKQTAPEHLVRNPKNKPDDYEIAAFARLAAPSSPSDKSRIISEIVDGGESARLILPLYYRSSCLACHGEPKGERDISGYPREGGKEGDLGGAISVKIPLK